MEQIHTILGAAGTIGSLLTEVLADRGEQVRAVARGQLPVRPGVHTVRADVSTVDGAAAAVAGASVVYLCVQPPYTRWPQEFPALAAGIADAAARAGSRLVMLDNLYGYGRVHGPIREDLPMAAHTRKGMVRAQIATDLLDRHARGDLSVSIGRASDFIGPSGQSLPNVLAIEPIAKGKPGRWAGRLDQPHSLSYTLDVARGLAVLGTHDEAFGRVWHLPVAGSPTGRELLDLACRIAGIQARPRVVTPLMNRLAGLFSAQIREGNEMMYEFTEAFVVDDSAFTRAFPGTPASSLDDAVRASLRGHQATAQAA
jgi:nucleoside-diphosphate-sugar epimerase